MLFSILKKQEKLSLLNFCITFIAFRKYIILMFKSTTNPLKVKFFICVALLFLYGFSVQAQSAKTLFKSGKEAAKQNKHTEAIAFFTDALLKKPNYLEVFEERSKSYLALKNYEKALADFLFLQKQSPKETKYIIASANNYMLLLRWADAQYMFMKLESDAINLHILEAKEKVILCKLYLKNFEDAFYYINENISIFPESDMLYFYKGVDADSLKDYQTAIFSYTEAIKLKQQLQKKAKKKAPITIVKDTVLSNYYYHLGKAQYAMYDFESAKQSLTKAIPLDDTNFATRLLRARAFYAINDINEALADIAICETKYKDDYSFNILKARILKKAGQFLAAANALKPMLASDTAFQAYYLSAQCYESIGENTEAQTLYLKAAPIAPKSMKIEAGASVKRIKSRLYEEKREREAPQLKLTSPALDIEGNMMITKSQTYVDIIGTAYDLSAIKSVNVNGFEADFKSDSLNPNFKIKINLYNKQEVTIKLIDVYDNTSEQIFAINRLEKNAPSIKLFLNYSEARKQIFHDKKLYPTIKISGRIEDESLIKSIEVNNKSASFDGTLSNPSFELELNIGKTDSLKYTVTDEYNNTYTVSYFINSAEALQMAENPMGKTWLIFIANSNYEFYNSLTGPDKDLDLIRTATQQYQFDEVIAKRNMTLSEMDKFFRIELRDQIKEQQVNSVVIWFAGHGRYFNETGYWIPVNARKEEEISFFPIPYLRSNLGTYGSQLKRILIVSDACESGPSFSLTQDNISDFKCGSSEELNATSAIVFSSTTNEKASDNSLFCESFANLLQSNEKGCLPLTDIVKSVAKSVEMNQAQRCKFGRIKGFDNNSGSFYFMKRK